MYDKLKRRALVPTIQQTINNTTTSIGTGGIGNDDGGIGGGVCGIGGGGGGGGSIGVGNGGIGTSKSSVCYYFTISN